MSEDDLTRRQNELMALFPTAPIARTYGMTLTYPERGRARFDLPFNPAFDHGLGQIHGSVMGMLVDNAGWFTAAVQYDTWIATAEFHTRLLQPVDGVDLWSVGRLVRAGRHLAVADVEVRTGAGDLIAVGSGSFSVTSVSRRPRGR